MKFFFFSFLFIWCNNCLCQKNGYFNQEFTITTDNDFYALKSKDSYYSNGLFLQYAKAQNKKGQKIIKRLELGQATFTQQHQGDTWRLIEPLDRPFCGYLYLRYTKEKFLQKSTLFNYKLEAAVTGKISQAQALQEALHKTLNISGLFPQWENQIPNSFGFTIGAKYATTVAHEKANESSFKIVPMVQANVGNFFINVNAGAYFCLGKFEKTENSALLNARINTTAIKTKHKYELIFYCYPQIVLQGYNATIQGNLFAKNFPAIVFVSKPQAIMLQNALGAVFAKNRFTTRVEAVYQTKEAVSQLNGHEYISLQAAYRF